MQHEQLFDDFKDPARNKQPEDEREFMQDRHDTCSNVV